MKQNIQKLKFIGRMTFWSAMYSFLFTSAAVAFRVPAECIFVYGLIGLFCGLVIQFITRSDDFGYMKTRLVILFVTLSGFIGMHFYCALGLL